MEHSELMPVFDARKSFYGKARVMRKAGDHYNLYSYGALVAEFEPGLAGPGKYIVHDFHSATTTRHIVEFMRQRGIRPSSLEVGRIISLTGADVTDDYVGNLL